MYIVRLPLHANKAQRILAPASAASHACVECASKTDTEKKKLLNEVITFVFFEHKKNILVAKAG